MGEEVRITDYDVGGTGGGHGEDDERVLEWEAGLPEVGDLTPLSQLLISSDLLAAFNITPEPYRSMIDVNRASQNTISDLRGESEKQSVTGFDCLKSFSHEKVDEMVVEGEETADLIHGGSVSRKLQRIDSGGGGGGGGDVDGGGAVDQTDFAFQADDSSARVLKRPRLVWTPQLHKRFIEVVAHLGVKNAVPKTIMQLMNVEGLSRENVASHLQKYRLYIKRMQVGQSKTTSSSDHLFTSIASTPENLHESGTGSNGYRPRPAAIPMPNPPQMVHLHNQYMPYPPHQMVPNSGFNSDSYRYNNSNNSNNAVQQRNWSGNMFDSGSEYHHS